VANVFAAGCYLIEMIFMQYERKEETFMSRSLKKGPYVSEKLLKKIVDMNNAGEKKVIRS